MAVDKDFIKSFENQILVLEGLEKAIQAALADANQKLGQMKAGETMEKVFGVPPKK